MPNPFDRLLSALSPELRQLRADVTALQQQVGQMATKEQLEAGFKEVDDATNELATEVEELRGAIQNGSIPDDAVTRLDGIAARLRSIAADPENPAPPAEG